MWWYIFLAFLIVGCVLVGGCVIYDILTYRDLQRRLKLERERKRKG